MSDIVVTVPINFTHSCAPGRRGLDAWAAEGDPAGSEWSGRYWAFTTFGARPSITRGERVYVVCEDRIRGYSPLEELEFEPAGLGKGYITFTRGGDAVAVTLPAKVRGFRGWRYRWWKHREEVPFEDWLTADRRHAPQPEQEVRRG